MTISAHATTATVRSVSCLRMRRPRYFSDAHNGAAGARVAPHFLLARTHGLAHHLQARLDFEMPHRQVRWQFHALFLHAHGLPDDAVLEGIETDLPHPLD